MSIFAAPEKEITTTIIVKNQMKRNVLLFLFIICYTNIYLHSNIKINRLDIVDYLPNNNVKKIFQCSDGYIWIGTEGGLCRYDGYDILQVANMTTIDISNNILSIAEDKYGRIWAGTRQGIQIVNKHGQSINLLNNSSNNNKLQEKRINSICITGDSAWIGTNEGIILYNILTKTFKIFQHNTHTPNSLPSNNVVNIFSDKSGDIWISLWYNGLCKFNKSTSSFEKLPPIGKKNSPFNVMQGTDNAIWVSCWGDGLVRIDKNSNNNPYHYSYYNVGGKNVVYSAVEDKSGQNIWLITPEGLYKRSKNTTEPNTYINTKSVYNKSSNFFHTITKDIDGNIWIGASNDGIYLINTQATSFDYNIIPEIKNKVGYSIVNSITEIDGLIWIGLTNAGVIALDPQKNFRTAYYNNLNNTSIRHLKKNPYSNELLAVGDESFIINYNKNKTTVSPISWKTKNNLTTENANCVYYDDENNIWIGTLNGLFRKNKNSNTLLEISKGFNNVSGFVKESNQVFWVASNNKGILRISKTKNQLTIKSYNLKNKLAPTSMITSLMIDSDNNLWAGTNDCGLCLYSKETDKFIEQNEKYAILEKTITNIIEDKRGSLWVASNNKILKINTVQKFSTVYSSNDNDIQVSTFRPLSALLSTNNTIYFGGNEGFCFFSSELNNNLLVKNRTILITNIKVLNQSIFDAENKIPYDGKKLTLKHFQNNFSIEFSSLNFSTSNNVKYAYRLKGLDNRWVFVDSKHRSANYNNLESGHYTFEVKTTNSNGTWSDKFSTIIIHIKPAPYLSWWAYALYAALLISITIALFRTINNRIKLRNEAIINKIEKEKSKELIQIKLNYFTNVSHELLTPLTIISCIVDELKQQNGSDNIQYPTLRANINRLKRLLQQILDFQKTESENMKLRVEEEDLVQFLKNICIYNFSPIVLEKNIKFEFKSSLNNANAWFDSDKIDKIIYNLLSNAIKYSPTGGSISVELSIADTEDKQQEAIVSVSDTGIGISAEFLPRIFDQFVSHKPHRDVETNGIGLSLVKELLKIHLGTISVESTENKGSTFTFKFPINKESYIINNNIDVVEKNTIQSIKGVHIENNNSLTGFKILFIEDNVDLNASLERYFKPKCNVSTALTAEIALNLLNEREFDLIVSDIMLPGINGIEFCSHLKSKIEFSHIPVLILTAKNMVEDRIKCYEAGADAYISKPFELELLEARMKNLLSKRKNKNESFKTNININISDLEYCSIDEEFLKEAILIVENNIGDFNFTQEVLMSKLNSTRSTLYRKLKSLTGLSPSEFIKNIRMKHACAMLNKGTGNISDIAYAVGFNDPRYFSTCFRQEFGVTPSEYNKNQLPHQ